MSEDRSLAQMSDKDLMINIRLNIEKAKAVSNSANKRSIDTERDLQSVEMAMVRLIERVQFLEKEIQLLQNKKPWYKKIIESMGLK